MHNPAAVLENKTHKLIWDLEIQTDHLILARHYNNKQKKKPTKIPRELAELWTFMSRMTPE